MYDFSFNYSAINKSDMSNIHKYLMVKTNIDFFFFDLIKQFSIVLLSLGEFLATKHISLNNEPCMARPFLTDLNPGEVKYYPFMISLDKCGTLLFILLIIIIASKQKLTCINVKTNIKSVFNKDQNHYYYNVLLEKSLYQLTEK